MRKIFHLYIMKFLRLHLNALNDDIFTCIITRYDILNYLKDKRNQKKYDVEIKNININELVNAVSIYHYHLAHCLIYLNNNIVFKDKKIKADDLKYIQNYKYNRFYIVKHPLLFEKLKLLYKHENI